MTHLERPSPPARDDVAGDNAPATGDAGPVTASPAAPAAPVPAAPAAAPLPAPPLSPPSPAPVTPPSIADGRERRLDPRWLMLRRVAAGIFAGATAAVLFLAIVIVTLAVDLFVWVTIVLALFWLGVAGGLGWLAYRWPALEHRHAGYRVDERGIEIRRGVFWRRVLSVPRTRVQHIDVSQGPLERDRGLGTLEIYTAGTDHAKVALPGLDHETALAIRDHLLPREDGDAV